MIRIDYLLLGYRKILVEEKDIKLALKLFLKNNINIKFYGNAIYVSAVRYKKISRILATRVKFTVSEVLGFPGFLYRNRKRYGVTCALLFTIVFLLYSSDKVWDIRISGSDGGYNEEILRELSDCGFYVGKSFRKTDFSKTELMLLEMSDYVSWVNIYRRGNVAYVTVVDKITYPEKEEKNGYSNIVASCDAIIEEITVFKGVAMVKPGESVKAGQLLISGILPNESGGGFCYAEGRVVGRISETVESNIASKRVLKIEESSDLFRLKINFFNFSCKIFQSYGKSMEEYAIIEKNKSLSVFGKNLPISVKSTYKVFYSEAVDELSESEMAELALSDMQEKLNERLRNATLIRLRTEGAFLEDGYTLKTQLVLTCEIGKDLPFNFS